MQELNLQEINEVSGGTTKGAAMVLGATVATIGIGVFAAGPVAVAGMGIAAVLGLGYAYDELTSMAAARGGGRPPGLKPPPAKAL